MGERGNIKVTMEDDTSVYFYTHWTGYYVQHDLANALDRGRGRWNDPSYLARIIFSEMLRIPDNIEATHERLMDVTGFGIDTQMGDNSYCVPEVLVKSKEVFYRDKVYTFDEFIEKYKKD